MNPVVFPQLGFATHGGLVVRWFKTPGEAVTAGEPLVEIAFEKALSEVEATADGVLLKITAPAGAEVPEGEIMGWVGQQGEDAPENGALILGWDESLAPPPEERQRYMAEAQEVEPPPVRMIAKPEKASKQALKGHLRGMTAERMANSWNEKPKVDLFFDADFSRIVAHRTAAKAAGENALPFNVYIAQAAVAAMREFPQYNGHLVNGSFYEMEPIHVGFAVALGENLLTVSVKNLQQATLEEINLGYKGMIRKALAQNLAHEDLFGSSLTITNLGEFDVTAFTAIINPPEIFILSVGKLEDRAVVVEGEIVVRPMSTLCLSFDHRVIDGAPGAKVMQRIKHYLEHGLEVA